MKKSEYVVYMLIWSVISMFYYKSLLFRTLDDYSLVQSNLVLWGIIAIFSAIGMSITFEKQRNFFGIFCIETVSYFCYTVLAYYDYRHGQVKILLRVIFLIIGVLTILVFRKKGSFNFKLRQSLLNAYRITAMVVALSVILIGCGSLFKGKANSNISDTQCGYASDYTIAKNIEILQNLQEEKWTYLSVDEKVAVLQTVANIEAHYLGLSHGLTVKVAILDSDTLGTYNDRKHRIQISLDEVKYYGALRCVKTVCHEAYHAYEYQLVQVYDEAADDMKALYIFRDAKKYKSEFENYIHGSEDYDAYYEQSCEEAARDYAYDAMLDYKEKVYSYTTNNNE